MEFWIVDLIFRFKNLNNQMKKLHENIYCVRYVQNLQIRLEEIGVGPEAGGPQDPGPGPRPGAGKGGHGGKGTEWDGPQGRRGGPPQKKTAATQQQI